MRWPVFRGWLRIKSCLASIGGNVQAAYNKTGRLSWKRLSSPPRGSFSFISDVITRRERRGLRKGEWPRKKNGWKRDTYPPPRDISRPRRVQPSPSHPYATYYLRSLDKSSRRNLDSSLLGILFLSGTTRMIP